MAQVPRKNIVVIGAGVIGLSTAIKLQEKRDYTVSIIAETFPTDPKCIKYTSHWAGAHHVCAAAVNDLRQQSEGIHSFRSWGKNSPFSELERETFDVMWEMSSPGGEAEGCFLRAPQTEYYASKEGDPNLHSFSLCFRRLEPSAFANVPEAISAVSFSALNINTPAYLPYLLSRFLRFGGHIVRASIQYITQILEGGVEAFVNGKSGMRPVDALIICAGLGARTLGGVEDQDVYPVRGQTVLLHAPWVNEGRSLVVESVSKTYIIPRQGGTVVVGGTRVADDWYAPKPSGKRQVLIFRYPIPRPETTVDILERGLALHPELAPPLIHVGREPTVEDLKPLIIEEGCGLRPARKGGIRLQSEWVRVPGSERRMVPVIHNYGHGGYGFQTSWGSASVAVELLEQALAKGSRPQGELIV